MLSPKNITLVSPKSWKTQKYAAINTLLDAEGIFVVITPLLEQVPDEKKNIPVSSETIELLRQNFNEIAWYQENGLSYFIGELKQ